MAKATDDAPITDADLAKLEDDSADFDDDPDNAGWADGDDDGDDEEEDSPKNPSPKRTDEDEEDEDDLEDADGDEDAQDSEEDDDSDEDPADPKDKEDPVEKALKAERAKHNDEMAQARIAEKKARDDAAKAREAATESAINRYIDEAGDDEAERKNREQDVEQFRIREERISLNDERLQNGVERAVVEIPLFNSKDEAIQEELLSAVDDFEAKFVVKDKHGRAVEIKVDPATGKRADLVRYLKIKASSIERLTGLGATRQDKSKKNQRSRTTTLPSRAPKKKKVDEDIDAFDEEAKRW